jgi:hypothetical protein
VDLWVERVEKWDLVWNGAGLERRGFAARKVCPQFAQGLSDRWKSWKMWVLRMSTEILWFGIKKGVRKGFGGNVRNIS